MNIRNKGKAGESEFINRYGPFFPNPIKRNLLQTREGGADISGCEPFQIEIKRCERVEKNKWWAQVKAACKPDEIPVVAYRQNRGQWKFLLPVNLCNIDSEDYMEIAEGPWLKFVMEMFSRKADSQRL